MVCGVRTASQGGPWDDVRVPTNCRPFDKALNVYINEYVQVQPTIQPPPWKYTRLSLIHEYQPLQANILVYPIYRARGSAAGVGDTDDPLRHYTYPLHI